MGGRSSPSLNRPTTRPASRPSGSRPGYANRPGSGNRPISNRPGSGTTLGNRRPGSPNISRQGDRNINRSGDRNFNRNINRNVDRNINRNVNRNIHRDWNRTVNINNVNLRPGWARPGWGYARPWNHGWYGGWSSPTWGWWGARAAVWGVGTLATAAIINSAVDSAVSSNVTYIVVPNSGYQLQFGTVEPYPAGTSGVRFIASLDGTSYQLSADCQRGYLNGREPATAAQAELVNAACQVAFGST